MWMCWDVVPDRTYVNVCFHLCWNPGWSNDPSHLRWQMGKQQYWQSLTKIMALEPKIQLFTSAHIPALPCQSWL